MVDNISNNWPDEESENDLFILMAQHPSSAVRQNIAYKDNISEEICELLSEDTSVGVLRNLVRSAAFKRFASESTIEKIIKTDVEVAQNVAGDVDSFQHADESKLAALLSENSDPQVLESLANNSSTPKKILKTLSNHPDPKIAGNAKISLS